MCAEDLFMPLELDDRRAADTANVRLYEMGQQTAGFHAIEECRRN